jgi:transposase
LVERANIVLLVAEGKENLDIAAKLQISRQTVARWRDRFLKLGIGGIEKNCRHSRDNL